jgi:pimeloyl-ACP methyl ester carboxylesterase
MVSKLANLVGRSVRYLEAGAGRPVIFLHAFPLSADQWLPQLAKVPRGCRYLAPDLRGFRGAGPAPEPGALDNVTMDDYAADVLELMSHLDAPTADIVGLSMGGYVALAMVAMAPDRVTRLLLANTRASGDSPEARAGRDRTIALVRREGVGALARDMAPKLVGETTRRQRPDLVDAVRELIERNEPDGIAAALAALRDRPDRTSLVPSIRCPTVVVTGDEDTLIAPAETEKLAQAIPGARFVTVPGAGHLTNLEGDLSPILAP